MAKNRHIKKLVEHMGGPTECARQLGVSQPTAWNWANKDHGMSAVNALKAEQITGGKFKAVDLCPDLLKAHSAA